MEINLVMSATCPIHLTNECIKFKKTYPVLNIVNQYKEIYNINVEHYFYSLKEIKQCVCTETGYIFFFPFIQGDQLFYKELSKHSQYYLPWKWEYEQALKWISSKDKVLEIACGNGAFLEKASNIAHSCIGIDTSAESFQSKNFEIIKEDYLLFLEKNTNKFDIIVSFQFLEHIVDVNLFFNKIWNSLSSSGKLILAVPDNNSKILEKEILNYPPHHLGWWTKASLKKTGIFFSFKTLYAKTEPLPAYFIERKLYLKEIKRIEKLGFLGKVVNKLTHKFCLQLFKNFGQMFKGHSFIIVFEKDEKHR